VVGISLTIDHGPIHCSRATARHVIGGYVDHERNWNDGGNADQCWHRWNWLSRGNQMTIGEFKAFIDGMGLSSAPSDDQWSRIVAKVDELQVTKAIPADFKMPIELGMPPKTYFGDPPGSLKPNQYAVT